MKNIKQILPLLLLILANTIMSQNREIVINENPSSITKPFAIKVGFLQTDLYGNDIEMLSFDEKTKGLNSFMIGLEYNSEISKFISLKHELNFKAHGAEIQLKDEINGTYNSKLKMNSLELQPINITFRYKWIQFYVGPYASALINANITRKDGNGNSYKDKSIFGKPDDDTEENKYLQKMDFGATAGLLFEFNKTISLGVRCSHGLVPIFDNATEQKSINIYNKALGVVIGYNL